MPAKVEKEALDLWRRLTDMLTLVKESLEDISTQAKNASVTLFDLSDINSGRLSELRDDILAMMCFDHLTLEYRLANLERHLEDLKKTAERFRQMVREQGKDCNRVLLPEMLRANERIRYILRKERRLA